MCLWVERTSSGSQRSLYCWSLRAPPFKWLPFPLSSPLLEQKLELREPSAVNLPLMLVQSAAAGNLVLVKKILKETKMAINTSDPEGRTALHEAIAHGMRVCCREVDGVAHTHKDRETDKTDRHTHTLTLTHTHTHTHTHSLSLSLSLSVGLQDTRQLHGFWSPEAQAALSRIDRAQRRAQKPCAATCCTCCLQTSCQLTSTTLAPRQMTQLPAAAQKNHHSHSFNEPRPLPHVSTQLRSAHLFIVSFNHAHLARLPFFFCLFGCLCFCNRMLLHNNSS